MRHHEESQKDAWIAAQLGNPVDRSNRKKPFVSFAIIGLASCLSLFGLGSAWGDAEDSQAKPKKNAIITPKATRNADASPDLQPESFESYQIRILRNQNQLQAEKIQTLRDELTELTQKLHDAKSHLFAYGDPTDKKKIAELSLELADKQQTIEKLSSATYNLQSELNNSRKKLFEMETVREALTAMIEQHRVARETAIETLQKQLVALDQTKESEKQALSDQIQEKEKIHADLQQLISERSETINRLDALASNQDYLLASKQAYINELQERVNLLADEIAATTEAYASSNQNHAEHLSDIGSVLDYEQTDAEQLRDYREQTRWLADLYDSVHVLYRSQIDQMRSQLDDQEALRENLFDVETQLAIHRQEKSVLESANFEHKALTDNYLHQLSSLIETEEARSLQLESQYVGLSKSYDQSQIYAQTLEDLLEKANAMLADQQEQMELNENDHADILGTILQHFDLLEEKQRDTHDQNTALGKNLADLHEEHYTAKNEFAERLLSIENERLLEKSQFAGHLNEQSAALADREERIAALEQSHAELQSELEEKVSQLNENIEKELLSSYYVELLLQDASNYLNELEARLEQHQNIMEQQNQDIQNIANYHNSTSLDLQSQLNNLQQALRDEQSQAEALRHELTELQAKHYEGEGRYSEAIRRSSEFEEDLIALADEKEAVQSQLALATLNLGAALSALDHLAGERSDWESSKQNFAAENDRYRSQLDQIQNDHATLRGERDAAHAELAEARQNLSAALSALDQLSNEYVALQNDGEKFTGENNQYRSQLSQLQNDHAALRDDRDNAHAELALARDKLQAALASFDQLQQQHSSLRNDSDSAAADLSFAREKLNKALEALDQLSTENDKLKKAGQHLDEENSGYRDQLDQLQRDHAELRDQRDSAHSELALAYQKLNFAIAALDEIATEKESLQHAGQNLDDENSRYRERLDQLQKEHEDLRNDRDAIYSNLAQSQQKLDSALAALDRITAEKDNLQLAGQNLDDQNNHYRNRLEQLQREHADLRDDRDAAQSELSQARQKLDAALAALDRLSDERNNLQQTGQILDDENSRYRDQLSQAQQKLDAALAALDRLSAEKYNLQQAGQNLGDENSHYRDQLSQAQQKLQTTLSTLDKLADEKHDLAETVRQLDASTQSYRTELEQLQQQHAALKGEWGHARKELAQTKEDLSNTKANLNNTQVDLNNTKAVLEDLKSEKSDLQNAGRDLEASGKAYREKLEKLMSEIAKEREHHQQNADTLHQATEEYRQRLEHALVELNEAQQLLAQTRTAHGQVSEERQALQVQIRTLTDEISKERQQFFEMEQNYNQQLENNMIHTNEAQKNQSLLQRMQDRLQQKDGELAQHQSTYEDLIAERERVQELTAELGYIRSLQFQERETTLNLQELTSDLELKNRALESRLAEAEASVKASHALIAAKSTEASSHAQAYKKIEEAEALYKQALDRSAKTEEQLRAELDTERNRFFAVQDELLEAQYRLKEIESKFDAAQQYIGEKGPALPKSQTRTRRAQNIKTAR